jgi:hypothetical protein
MEFIKNFVILQISAHAALWQWATQIYIPVLVGFFN